MDARICICMYVCMHVCVYMYMYVYIFHRLDMTLAVAEVLNPNKPNQTICIYSIYMYMYIYIIYTYKLFKLLRDRNLPAVVIIKASLRHVHYRQRMCTNWSGARSNLFHTDNGVKQGGILSPILFCVYFDEGCHIGHVAHWVWLRRRCRCSKSLCSCITTNARHL